MFGFVFLVVWVFINFVGYLLLENRTPGFFKNLVFLLWAPFWNTTEIFYQIFSYRQIELEEYKKIAHSDIALYRLENNIPMMNGITIPNAEIKR